MKITLEPSELDQPPAHRHPKVSVETAHDDMAIDELFEQLIIPALLGMGFMKETIDNYLNDTE